MTPEQNKALEKAGDECTDKIFKDFPALKHLVNPIFLKKAFMAGAKWAEKNLNLATNENLRRLNGTQEGIIPKTNKDANRN